MFWGAEDKGKLLAFLAVGWDREEAVMLWDISEVDRDLLLQIDFLSHMMFLCRSVAISYLITYE